MSNEKKLYTVIKILMSGQKLNSYQFQKLTGSQRLAVFIHVLSQKHHWQINRQWGFCQPTGTRLMSYWLDLEEIHRIQNKTGLTTAISTALESNEEQK